MDITIASQYDKNFDVIEGEIQRPKWICKICFAKKFTCRKKFQTGKNRFAKIIFSLTKNIPPLSRWLLEVNEISQDYIYFKNTFFFFKKKKAVKKWLYFPTEERITIRVLCEPGGQALWGATAPWTGHWGSVRVGPGCQDLSPCLSQEQGSWGAPGKASALGIGHLPVHADRLRPGWDVAGHMASQDYDQPPQDADNNHTQNKQEKLHWGLK